MTPDELALVREAIERALEYDLRKVMRRADIYKLERAAKIMAVPKVPA